VANQTVKASRQSSRSGKESLIERAAQRLGTEPAVARAFVEAATPKAASVLGPAVAMTPDARAESQPQTKTTPKPKPRAPARRAVVDRDLLRRRGMVCPTGVRSRVAEEFRVLKRPLLVKAFRHGADAIRNGNMIMVVSARPEEGKTFTATCLAMSIAQERDTHVLLVDTDFHRPMLLNNLGLEAEKGLIDVIEDESMDLADVLIRTDIEHLTILPAGKPHPMSTELLASERMGLITKELAQRYPDRIIIFDTAPLLASSEASVLCMYVGQIIFVVEAEKTSQDVIQAALELIGSCENIGFVLNKARARHGNEYFGSYYSYHKP